VYCVLSAIRERKKQFVFTDGSVVDLDDRVGFFITMNPGYAGRQELPENLKALFRGVTMMVPNRQIIMKVKLAACGYQENDIISKKFFVLYGLCEQQLSKQAHYDFGLRNILSVLRTGGASKRASPDKSEIFLMMRTLRDMNMSKFVAEDVPLFMSLIKDLFPGLEAERASFPEVEKALHEQIIEKGLQARTLPVCCAGSMPGLCWLCACFSCCQLEADQHCTNSSTRRKSVVLAVALWCCSVRLHADCIWLT
jgi:dynein heavy chain, axonemal